MDKWGTSGLAVAGGGEGEGGQGKPVEVVLRVHRKGDGDMHIKENG